MMAFQSPLRLMNYLTLWTLISTANSQNYRLQVDVDPPWGEIYVSCSSSAHDEHPSGLFSSKGSLTWEFSGSTIWHCSAEWSLTACLSSWFVPGVCGGFNVFSCNFQGCVPIENNTWVIDGRGKHRIRENDIEVDDLRSTWDGPIPPEFITPPNDLMVISINVRPPSGEIYVHCYNYAHPELVHEEVFTENGTLTWEFRRTGFFDPVFTCYAIWDGVNCLDGWDFEPSTSCGGFPVYGRLFSGPDWAVPSANNTWLIDGRGKRRVAEGDIPVNDFISSWDLDDSFIISQRVEVEIGPQDSEVYLVCTGYLGDGTKEMEQRRAFPSSGVMEWTFREKGAERRSWRCSAFNDIGCLWKWAQIDGMTVCLEFPVYGDYFGEVIPLANNTWSIDSVGKRRIGEWGEVVNDYFAEWDPFQ